MALKTRKATEVNAGSMADIAFLLLIFFLVTTTIASDKGIAVMLPPKQDNAPVVDIHERNLFNIQVNSSNMFLIEGERATLAAIKIGVQEFLLNNGRKSHLSDSPAKAVVSVKVDRGSSYATYVQTYDQLRLAYNELRADFLGLTLAQYTALDKQQPEEKAMLASAAEAFPFRVSDAEPTDLSKFNQ